MTIKAEKPNALVFTSLAHFINDGGLFIVPLIFAILASEEIVSPIIIAIMPVVFYGASLLLSIYVANISDRTQRHGLLIGFGLALLSIGLMGFAISMNCASGAVLEALLLISAFVAGLGSAFYHPIGAAILQYTYFESGMGKALGINGSMGSLGRALYPSIFFGIASLITENGSIIFLGFLGISASIVISFCLRNKQNSAMSKNETQSRVAGSIKERITK
ncbi:MAG: MFS transporter [Candidatus Bathyarchaeia archaeon]